MAVMTLEGIYRDGKIELENVPEGTERARVRGTFFPEQNSQEAITHEAARQRAFARMREGIHIGDVKFDRTEIYEDRMRELVGRQDNNR